MFSRLHAASRPAIALGAVAGAALGAAMFGALSTLCRGLFHAPAGGVGFVTVHAYPKGFDYFVVGMLFVGAMVGGLLGGIFSPSSQKAGGGACLPTGMTKTTWVGALVIFLLMLVLHDHPYALMEPFHEGEHLTPALAFQSGARPFGEVFVLHGLAVDGGLDALVLGDPPSPRRERRLETLLDAAALALLVPIAAEVCVTSAGVLLAALAGLCAIAAFEVPVFPYFRLAPLLLAVLMLLRFARTRGDKALFAAMAASTLGLLWSLDVGLYAVMTTAIALLLLRAWRPLLTIVAAALPFVVLLLLRADVPRFLHDSFVVIPRSIDAVWSLPMRTDWSWESARYFLPPALFGMLAVFALRAPREERMRVAIITIASLFAFRTAAGRCGWSHTRYGVPLIGIALVAFVAEPLFIARRRVAAVIITAFLIVYVELIPNLTLGARLLGGWRGRQSHAGLVSYPLRTGKGIYTTPENAADLAALNGFLNLHAPPGAPLLDVSNERALLYLLERRPATRCNDIAMLSSPILLTEALRQLDASPPPAVILSGNPAVDDFDGLPNRQRVSALFAWIDAHYPRRQQVGRFVVATK